MIRPTTPEDTPALLDLARGTGVFRGAEVEVLRGTLDDYHDGDRDSGHRAATYEHAGRPAGLAYYAPALMTDRTWYLYWIVVDARLQKRGIGSSLLIRAEADVRDAGGRLLVIETSSLQAFEATRRFYAAHHFAESCTLPDYYADGDGLVIFAKRLLPGGPAS